LRQHLPKKTQSQRIENRSGQGMPDLYMCMDGAPVWCELKIIKSGKVKLSKSQIAWHSSHSRCNGVSFILAHDPFEGSVYLFDGAFSAEIQGSRVNDLQSALLWRGDLRSAPCALRTCALESWSALLRTCDLRVAATDRAPKEK